MEYRPRTNERAQVEERRGVAADDDERESEFQRRNRNFNELLQELRVAQTGVQILFAFLLTLPFSSRADVLSGVKLVAYVITLVAASAATAFLIAPVSYHRLVFREGRKPEVLAVASVLAQLGVLALLVALVGALFLAVDVVAGQPTVALVTTVMAGVYVVLWYLLPALNRHRVRVGPGSGPEGRLARQGEQQPTRSGS